MFVSDVATWTPTASVSPFMSSCDGNNLLGGYNIGGTFKKTYTGLPAHNLVSFSIPFYVLDDWKNGDKFTFKLGSYTYNFNGGMPKKKFWDNSICGASHPDLGEIKVRGWVLHTGGSITIEFIDKMPSKPKDASFGVRNIKLLFRNQTGGESNSFCGSSDEIFGTSTIPGFSCKCPPNAYSVGSSCSPCHSACDTCYGPSASQCYACADNAFYDGTKCNLCSSNCKFCETSPSNCYECSAGFYLLSDNSCSPTCTLPISITTASSYVKRCTSPCSSSQYLYWNTSCLSTCPAPFITKMIGNDKICDYPCLSTEYLYPNGTCKSSCSSPYLVSVQGGKKFCISPCLSVAQYYYDNGTCLDQCDPPYTISTWDVFNICNSPCPAGQYYYGDATCATSCPAPFISKVIGNLKYCNGPCPPDQYYYQDGTCNADCPLPKIAVTASNILYCQDPCPSGQYSYPDGTCQLTCSSPMITAVISGVNFCQSPCASNQYYYQNGSCIDTCDSPFTFSLSTYIN